jgi:hydroxyacylglutathione hydrolase
MLIETFPVGPLACNCAIVADLETRRAAVIDPGGNFEMIHERLARHRLQVDAILLTHAHIDHIGAAYELQRSTRAAARLHPADRLIIDLLGLQAAILGVPVPESPELQEDLVDNAVLKVGAIEFAVLHTPGHSPGSVGLLAAHGAEQVLFSGDTLFQGGVGRPDLWGGDHAALIGSIRNRLFTLGDSLRVIPGHGEETTIGDERRSNRFVRASA